MARYGQIHVYGGKANSYVINNEDYRVKVTKDWVPATDVWHIQFSSEGPLENRYEIFLTVEELEHLRRIL
tara:strand:- start:377 stop:586 length:210 start_codon:yes stop_codon:yes gene_type:complete